MKEDLIKIKNENLNLVEENKLLQSQLNEIKSRQTNRQKTRSFLTRKLGGYFLLGYRLNSNLKQILNGDISKDAIADLVVAVFYRLTRIGIIALIVAFIPIVLLWQQNKLLGTQNDKIERQNLRLDQQTSLMEANRRGSLVYLFGNIMDAIDSELKEDYNENEIRDLSPQLIGRIVALSQRLQPYYFLYKDALIDKPLSPERGQLLVSLVESQLDSTTYIEIFKKGNFQNSDLKEMKLRNAILPAILNLGIFVENFRSCSFAQWKKIQICPPYQVLTAFTRELSYLYFVR